MPYPAKPSSLIKVPFLAAALLCIPILTQGAMLSFSTPKNIPLDDDGTAVLNRGQLQAALTFEGTNQNDPSITLNGVDFDTGTSTTANGISLAFSAPGGSLTSNLSSSYTNTNWKTLFDGFGASEGAVSGGGIIFLTIEGLTVGRKYRLQSFHLANISNPDQRSTTIQNASLANPAENQSISFSQAGSTSDPGVSITSTWVADATTQNINFLSTPDSDLFSRSTISAVTLYDITGIPEPGHIALFLGILVCTLAIFKRRFQS